MADFVYQLPREKPTPAPYALSIGLDWQNLHTPPYAGGLTDQPIQLMKDIRSALAAYNSINAYRLAQNNLSGEAFVQFCNANTPIMKFMETVWKLQEEEQHAADG